MTDSPYGWWLPPNLSTSGASVDSLINVLHWFMGLLFVGWGVFFVYCLIRFRQRPGHHADYRLPGAKASKWAEVGVALFEAVLLFAFSVPAWGRFKNDFPTAEDNPLKVRVVAEQFAWNFHYPGEDGVFGRTDPSYVDPVDNPVGLDRRDPNAQDDIVTVGVFHMPNDRPVIAYLTSKDVIHCFWILVLRVKQDVIPGMEIPIWFQSKPDVTGQYEIACAQLCGNNHFKMKALLYIDSEEAFNTWLKGMAAYNEDEEEDE